ncbi:response regulator receiver domain, partial [Mycobacterium tuberculosis]|uniref:response regulator receiver domain n=1 Tax=Mycobacterium tuberculosis TaxID=1773 RepID=UPI001AE9D445
PGKDAEVKIKPLADAFLDKRIVCGVLKPEPADNDAQVIERAALAATVADVVIVDWYLRPNQDSLARSILQKILTKDRE